MTVVDACLGGSMKRQFAPRFTNPAHGGTSDRSPSGYIADVSAVVTVLYVALEMYVVTNSLAG